MKMKKRYLSPQLEMLKLTLEDICALSGFESGDGNSDLWEELKNL